MSDVRVDLDRMVEDAWRLFREALTEALETLGESEHLLVTLGDDEEGDDEDGAQPYVQIMRMSDNYRLETTSNRFLADARRLTKPARRQLRALGLAKPSVESPNYWVDCPTRHVDRAASLAIAAFRDVHGVPHPAFLRSNDFSWQGPEGQLPVEVDPAVAVAVYPETGAHLDNLIDQALMPVLGWVPERDVDGDLPWAAGSTIVYVRTAWPAPVIRLFAVLVVDVHDEELALREMNELRHELPGVILSLQGDAIIATADVWCRPFVAEHLQHLMTHMCAMVELHDKALAARVGGQVLIDEDEETGDRCARRDAESEEVDDGLRPAMVDLFALHLRAPGELRAKKVAKICGHDTALIRRLIQWNEDQRRAWREARDEAAADGQLQEAAECEESRARAKAMVQILGRALRRVDG